MTTVPVEFHDRMLSLGLARVSEAAALASRAQSGCAGALYATPVIPGGPATWHWCGSGQTTALAMVGVESCLAARCGGDPTSSMARGTHRQGVADAGFVGCGGSFRLDGSTGLH